MLKCHKTDAKRLINNLEMIVLGSYVENYIFKFEIVVDNLLISTSKIICKWGNF